MLPSLEREGDVREQRALTGRHRQLLHLDDRPAAARGFQKLEAQPSGAAAEQRSLPRGYLLFLLEPYDLGELRLRLAGLALLVAEALDEALQAGDVVGHAIDRLLRVQRPLGLLTPPDVPRARKERGAPASSSSTAVVTASRNHRSWATRITAASSDWSSRSSHSRLATSRWFVGSSRSRRSGSPASARAATPA